MHDYYAVQVWDDATRDGLLITDTDLSESWYAGNWSRTVYVEGMRASGGTPSSDPKLDWCYFGRDVHPLHGWNGEPPSRKRLMVVHVDVDMDGVTDDHYTYPGITEETTPGGFVPLDDFVELTVKQVHPILTDPPNWPEVTLSVTYLGDGRVRVWNASKTQVITLPHALSPTQDTTFWVEGHETSSDPCDTQLSLTHSTTGFKDTINLTVVEVDLDIAGVADANEETVGGFVALNDDDDDDSKTPDKDEIGPHTEDDLRGIALAISPSLQTGTGKLEATAGHNHIRVWIGANKDYLVFPAGGNYYETWDLSSETLPPALGVEGYSPSSGLRDVELTLSYERAASMIHDDKVRMTVVDVDFVEDLQQTYGFDSYTDPFYPYKSVKADGWDTAMGEITPSAAAGDVYFVRTTGSSVDVGPSPATTSPETVVFQGLQEGLSVVWAKLGSPGPFGVDAAVIGVPAYTQDSYSIAVRVVHETNYNSTDPYTAWALESYLDCTVYNQAVVNFTVTKLDPMTVPFDLNADGQLDVSSWTTAEMDVIIQQCKDDNYDYNIFLVDNPNDGSLGFMSLGQRYGFVHADVSNHEENTTAHELGHGAFSLEHSAVADTDNLMHPTEACPERLRKHQWDLIQ